MSRYFLQPRRFYDFLRSIVDSENNYLLLLTIVLNGVLQGKGGRQAC